MGKKRKGFLIAAAVLVILAVAVAATILVGSQNSKATLEAVIAEANLPQIPDGTFHGKHSAFPVIVEVDVTVKDHAITAIDLVRHMNGQGEAAEVIPQKVVEAQSLLVDTVSGATYSSKAMLIAIQNALQAAAGE